MKLVYFHLLYKVGNCLKTVGQKLYNIGLRELQAETAREIIDEILEEERQENENIKQSRID